VEGPCRERIILLIFLAIPLLEPDNAQPLARNSGKAFRCYHLSSANNKASSFVLLAPSLRGIDLGVVTPRSATAPPRR